MENSGVWKIVVYGNYIDWHKLLKGKSDTDFMHILMKKSLAFSQIGNGRELSRTFKIMR